MDNKRQFCDHEFIIIDGVEKVIIYQGYSLFTDLPFNPRGLSEDMDMIISFE
jgi:hypothetical protein